MDVGHPIVGEGRPAVGATLAAAAVTVLLLLLLMPSSALAQRCAPGTVTLAVDGKTLELSGAEITRIPYGRDMTAWIAPEKGRRAVDVVARYRVTSADRGVRTDLVEAKPTADSTCWAAGLQKLHLNETGELGAALYLRPRYRPGAGPSTLVTAFLDHLGAIPSGTLRDEFVERAGRAAAAAAAAAYVDPSEVVVVEDEPRRTTALVERLAVLPTADIGLVDIPANIVSDAGEVRDAARDLAASPTVASTGVASCDVATSLTGLVGAAGQLASATDAEIRARIADGRLPWPRCVLDLVGGVTPVSSTDSFHLRTLKERTDSLVVGPRVMAVAEVVRGAREVAEQSASVETLAVPFGADILERYTQVDLVSAYLPDVDITHEFAAATWYFFTPGESNDFSAGIEPGKSFLAGDRWGLQVGYPVGAPVTGGDDDEPFEPSILVGLIGRINGVLSLSGGAVVGRKAGLRKSPGYVSVNVDLSNLGPLQKIFARRDTQ